MNKGFLCKKYGLQIADMDENIFKTCYIALILLSALYDVVSVTKMVATTIYYHFFIALRLGNDNIYGTVYKSGSKTIAYHSLTFLHFIPS